MITGTVKVFSMNDCDWMAASSLEEAKAAYLKDYAGGQSEEDAFDDPCEVSPEVMQGMLFHAVEEEPPATRTFAEQLAKLIADGQEFPCFFASTKY